MEIKWRTKTPGVLLMGLVVTGAWVVVAPAWADDPAPEVDAITPTATWSDACTSGTVSDVVGACRTDNALVTYYMDSAGDYALEAPDQAVVNDVMNDIYDPTDLSTSYDSTPSYSGSAQTDVVFLEGNTGLGPGVIGKMWCAKVQAGSTRLCDRAGVMIRGMGEYTLAHTSHEVGHAVGLTHPNTASPSYQLCEAGFNVMRAVSECLTGPHLGLMLTRNIDFIY